MGGPAVPGAQLPPDRVALLVIDNDICRITANRLASTLPSLVVIVEEHISRRLQLIRRVRRLGSVRVIGQLAFVCFARFLIAASRRRIQEIIHTHKLKPWWPAGINLIRVPSVNSPECIGQLRQLDPKVVIVVGTRIISRKVLAAVPTLFINYHDGITPKYRGIRGGYWAKAKGDLENFGVTVHLIDAGVDTGAVLYQARVKPTRHDNYATFSYLQLASALPLIEQAARDAIAGTVTPQTVDLPSQLWTHPTLWGYIATGLRHGAW